MADRKARYAVLWNPTVLGEAVRGVPDEVQVANLEIPWAKRLGMRNLLLHECFGIDDQIVWATATTNVLLMAAPLRRLHVACRRGGEEAKVVQRAGASRPSRHSSGHGEGPSAGEANPV